MNPKRPLYLVLGISVAGLIGGCADSPSTDAAPVTEATEAEIRDYWEDNQEEFEQDPTMLHWPETAAAATATPPSF